MRTPSAGGSGETGPLHSRRWDLQAMPLPWKRGDLFRNKISGERRCSRACVIPEKGAFMSRKTCS